MYHPKDIINLIGDNVRKTGNPFGIPKFILNNGGKVSTFQKVKALCSLPD
jgi:hypothetical protein